MCGILGIIGKRVDRDIVDKCVDRMYHRGPNGKGIWQEDDITLAHRRLSILDLSSNGSQPMVYRDRYVITYNGEIYNYLEIRKDLERLGYSFFTECDTEVVLAAYSYWKESCLSKFNGMFAFCIYDKKTHECFVARDRFGVKPLFIANIGHGAFAFASEMKALVPFLPKKEYDFDLVTNTNVNSINRYETSDKSLVKGIERVKAGHYVIIKDGKLSDHIWWDLLDNLMDVPDSYEEQIEMFRELFLDACKIRMRSDVQIGTALSGGLDSSATISAMSHIANHGFFGDKVRDYQHAYIACFPNSDLDERRYAKQVTDYLGIKGTFLDIDPTLYWDNIAEAMYLFEEIYHTSPIPMMQIYNAEKKDGTVVTIDGHGADELFGGYEYDVFKALYNSNNSFSEAKNIIDTYQNMKTVGGSLGKADNLTNILIHVAGHKAKQKVTKNNEYTRLCSNHANTENWAKLSYFDKVLYDEAFVGILPTLLRNYDRYSMANSVEIRMPFLDYRIVSFAFSIGTNSKIRNGFSKAIIRDAVSPYMPKEIAYRKGKIGFNTPILEWIHGPLKEWFLDITGSQDFKGSNVIDSKEIRKKIEAITRDDYVPRYEGELKDIWKDISPYLWEKYFWKRAILN